MKVSLKQITGNGIDLYQTVSAKDLDLPEDMFDCLAPVSVNMHVERAGDELLADCEVSGKYSLTCGRCLKEFEQEKADHFKVIVDVEPEMKIIDFTEYIRQEMILAMSCKQLCSEGCKGLCPHCGSNLNIEQCKCERGHSVD
ncbi:MAG: DUF177 domain-containing protein [Candidatus Omnitrophota bacterium]